MKEKQCMEESGAKWGVSINFFVEYDIFSAFGKIRKLCNDMQSVELLTAVTSFEQLLF